VDPQPASVERQTIAVALRKIGYLEHVNHLPIPSPTVRGPK
jgi:hypothetical protein